MCTEKKSTMSAISNYEGGKMFEIFWCPTHPGDFPPEFLRYFCQPLTVQLACAFQAHAEEVLCTKMAECALYVRERLVVD